MKSDGAPVDWIESFDPIVVTISGIALSAKATSPNAAKLLINFATSRKGQEMIREMRRIPARTDVKPLAAKMDQSKLKLKAVPKEVYQALTITLASFAKSSACNQRGTSEKLSPRSYEYRTEAREARCDRYPTRRIP